MCQISIQVGDEVVASPKNNDFSNEFVGVIISRNKGYYQVRDQDDNVFDCDLDQLSLVED